MRFFLSLSLDLPLSHPLFHPSLHPQSTPIHPQQDDPVYKACLRVRNPQARLRAFLHACSGKKADDVSGSPQPTYRIDGPRVTAEFPATRPGEASTAPDGGERRQELSAEKAHEILRRMSDEDVAALGFDPARARPDWMVLTVLPVPPPPVRPSVAMDGGSARSEDDLTYKLNEIIKASARLARQEAGGAPAHIVREFTALLQFHVTTYLDNTKPGHPVAQQRSGRPIKSISQRLKGKEGRVRGNLMGKRVDFSARTVISGDPNLALDELGVPWSVALTLTVPETVTPHNLARLARLVENGPHPPPGQTGARYIVREDGQRLDLRFLRRDADRHLECGYTVERHLQAGDIVLFNRQPSLHKMSMMGHRVRILPYSTFRLNLSVTSPYNADFDGDEMNMHVPQTPETRAEAREIMAVPRNIVSPQANKPVIGIVQDTLLGARLMTKRDTFIPAETAMNMLMCLEDWDGRVPFPAICKPVPRWTGKQLVSTLLPRVNCRRTAAWYKDGEPADFSPTDAQVLIQDGELLTGTLCKKTLGASAGSLVHVVWMDDGPEAARAFLSQTQYLVNHWLLQHGFSIGIGDTVADEGTMRVIQETIAAAEDEVKKLTQKLQSRELEAQPGRTMMESFENQVNQVLNKARDDAGRFAQASLKDTNNVVRMVTAGSKGSFINISQMIACVGQQNVEGKRIPFGFAGRTLPHFTKDDLGPESRGFVSNSYLSGLTPQELFFHAMGGREGLIDTAVKTSSTGYIQRRLVKAMEDFTIRYDGTVRNAAGGVIQFLYGEDGMDGTAVEGQKLDALRLKEPAFRRLFRWELDDPAWAPAWCEPGTLEALRGSAAARAELDAEYAALCADLATLRTEVLRGGDASVVLPLNLKRLIWNAQQAFRCGAGYAIGGGGSGGVGGGADGDAAAPSSASTTTLSPLDVIARVRALCARLVVVGGGDGLSREAQRNATLLFHAHLRATLASKRVLGEHRLSGAAFDWLAGEVEARFFRALAFPGENVGTVAAQSIGEPTTQMTLNTFHFAGVSAKNVTLGVPRLTEIINVSKTIKTPSLSVYLTGAAARDREAAKAVQCALEHTTLRRVTAATEIHYDPDPTTTVIEEDRDFVASYWEMPDEGVDPDRMAPWLLRIELNREMMVSWFLRGRERGLGGEREERERAARAPRPLHPCSFTHALSLPSLPTHPPTHSPTHTSTGRQEAVHGRPGGTHPRRL
jgi:DNA-directed RNA polymerase II subunit RPB1